MILLIQVVTLWRIDLLQVECSQRQVVELNMTACIGYCNKLAFRNFRSITSGLHFFLQRLRARLIFIDSENSAFQSFSIFAGLCKIQVSVLGQIELHQAIGIAASAFYIEHFQRMHFSIIQVDTVRVGKSLPERSLIHLCIPCNRDRLVHKIDLACQ